MQCLICNLPILVDDSVVDDNSCQPHPFNESFNIFCNYLSLVSIKSKDTWNFHQNPIPFCSECQKTVLILTDLDHQLNCIKNTISGTVSNIVSQVVRSTSSSSPMDDDEESQKALNWQACDTYARKVKEVRQQLFQQCIAGEFHAENTPANANTEDDTENEPFVDHDYCNFETDTEMVVDDPILTPIVVLGDAEKSTTPSMPQTMESTPIINPSQGTKKKSLRFLKTKSGAFKCGICGVQRHDRRAMVLHITETHVDEDTLKASKIFNVFDQELGYQPKAVVIPHGNDDFSYDGFHFMKEENGFRCSTCHEIFKERANLLLHIRTNHKETAKFTCNICGEYKTFRTLHALRCHSVTHLKVQKITKRKKDLKSSSTLDQDPPPPTSNPLKKTRVYRWTRKKNALPSESVDVEQEIDQAENNIPVSTFICDLCETQCRDLNALNAHKKSKHTTTLWNCNQCPKKFKSITSLKTHVLTHSGIKPHECPECFQTFALKKYLATHITRQHTRSSEYLCDTCGKTFCRKDNRDKHQRRHSRATEEEPPKAKRKSPNKTPSKRNSATTTTSRQKVKRGKKD